MRPPTWNGSSTGCWVARRRFGHRVGIAAGQAVLLDNIEVSGIQEILSRASLTIEGALGGFGLAAIRRQVIPGMRACQVQLIALAWATALGLADYPQDMNEHWTKKAR